MHHTSYPAKLLLFGEYTIIQGAKALAVPLLKYSGQWQNFPTPSDQSKQQELSQLLTYLQKKQPKKYDLVAFKKALKAGEYFHSDIPQGYGAGSSGAVTAAVYDRFALQKITPTNSNELKALQLQLAAIESCFHGASSGADPLVCYLKKGVLFDDDYVQLISDQKASLNGFFLIDTHISRQTAPLVNLYKEWCEEEMYPLRLEVELIPLVEEAIDAFLEKDENVLLETIHQISHFQFKYFTDMLPADFRKPWLDALASDHTKLKLCGAGGGGFILGYSTDRIARNKLLADYDVIDLTL